MTEQNKDTERKTVKKAEKTIEQKVSNVRVIVILMALIVVIGAGITIAVLFMTGVLGGKILSCSTEQETDGEKRTMMIEYGFDAKGDKLRSAKMETTVETDDGEKADQYEAEVKEDFENEDSYKDFNDKGGKTLVRRAGNKVTAVVSGNSDAWKNLGVVEKIDEMNYDAAKEELDSQDGWTCK